MRSRQTALTERLHPLDQHRHRQLEIESGRMKLIGAISNRNKLRLTTFLPQNHFMMKFAIFLVCAAALMTSACSKRSGVVKRPGEPDYVKAFDQKLMDRAIQKAKDTKEDFIAALQNKPEGAMGFAIKKPFPTPNGGQEHIWLNEVSWDGKVFDAIINDEPVDTKAVKLGSGKKFRPKKSRIGCIFKKGSSKVVTPSASSTTNHPPRSKRNSSNRSPSPFHQSTFEPADCAQCGLRRPSGSPAWSRLPRGIARPRANRCEPFGFNPTR